MESNPLNDLSYFIIQAAIQVHRTLGPGLLEGVYRACFMHELRKRGLAFVSEQPVPIYYDGVLLDEDYRLDLLVEDQVVVELKAIERVLPVHGAQLLSYLRLTGKPLGLLINFNVPLLTDGVTRRINSGAADQKKIRSVDFAPKAHHETEKTEIQDH
jgi:GxxExxY protein